MKADYNPVLLKVANRLLDIAWGLILLLVTVLIIWFIYAGFQPNFHYSGPNGKTGKEALEQWRQLWLNRRDNIQSNSFQNTFWSWELLRQDFTEKRIDFPHSHPLPVKIDVGGLGPLHPFPGDYRPGSDTRAALVQTTAETQLLICYRNWKSYFSDPLLYMEIIRQMAGLFLLLFILYHLRRVFDRLEHGRIFDARHLFHLRSTGFALIAYPVFTALFNWFFKHYLNSILVLPELPYSEQIDRIEIDNAIHWEYILFGLLVFGLTEVFRYGLHLQKEQKLVI